MARKVKVSKVKRTNHRNNKIGRKGQGQGRAKNSRPFQWRKQKDEQGQVTHKGKREGGVPLPQVVDGEDDATAGEMLEMVEKEDVAFLSRAVTQRSYSLLKQIRCGTPSAPRGKRKQPGDDPALEKEYERVGAPQDFKRTKLLLPIKTNQGLVIRTTEEDMSDDNEEETVREEEGAPEQLKQEEDSEVDDENYEADLPEDEMLQALQIDPNREVTTVDLLAAREKLLMKQKFRIGMLASGLLEEPEQKAKNFKILLDMLKEEQSPVHLTVHKLVIVSLLEIFKDVIPGYQIKHPDVPEGMKLKKDTRQLWTYESALLKAYQLYLQELERMASVLRKRQRAGRQRSPAEERRAEVALRCLAQLIVSHPHFNFASNIAQMLITFLDHRLSNVRQLVADALKTVLRQDKRGEISLHIVRRINQLVRRKSHAVRPDVLSVLLSLHIKEVNLDAEKESEVKQRDLKNQRRKLILQSKRERKRKKRFKELEKEMLETKAEESKVLKQKNLTEITKLVFTIYFRVLKNAPTSKLLSMTLEGIAKFAHVINLDFYHDLVNVLDQLLAMERLSCSEQLHCVQTVFTILSGQGESLNIDPLRFYTHLYSCLTSIHAGSSSTEVALALRAVEMGILSRRRKVSQQRLLAFAKRLCTMALMQLHGAVLGSLGAIRGILMHNSTCEVLLDTDTSHGDGLYLPELPEPEYCGAGSSTLWELVPLSHHYHPTVRKVAQAVCQGVQSNEAKTLLPAEVAKLSCVQMADQYDCSTMVFRPAVPAPSSAAPHPHRGRILLADDEFYAHVRNVEASLDCKSPAVVKELEVLSKMGSVAW